MDYIYEYINNKIGYLFGKFRDEGKIINVGNDKK